jgi:hypothetical protein
MVVDHVAGFDASCIERVLVVDHLLDFDVAGMWGR